MESISNFDISSCKSEKREVLRPAHLAIKRQMSEPINMPFSGGLALQCLTEKRTTEDGRYAGEEYYPVVADLHDALEYHLKTILFILAVDRAGVYSIFPQRLRGIDQYTNSWIGSGTEFIRKAKLGWASARADHAAGVYVITEHPGLPHDFRSAPNLEAELGKALRANTITSLNHPVLARLGILDRLGLDLSQGDQDDE